MSWVTRVITACAAVLAAFSASTVAAPADLRDAIQALGWAPSGTELQLVDQLPRPPALSDTEAASPCVPSEAAFAEDAAEAAWKRRRPARVLTIWGLAHFGARAGHGPRDQKCQDLAFLTRQWQGALNKPVTGALTQYEVSELSRAISDAEWGRQPAYAGLLVGVNPAKTANHAAAASLAPTPSRSPSLPATVGSSTKSSGTSAAQDDTVGFALGMECLQLVNSSGDSLLAQKCEAALAKNQITAFQDDVHDALGSYYAKRKDEASQLRHQTAAIQLLPTAPRLNARGFILLSKGDNRGALQDFDAALKHHTSAEIRAMSYLGRALANDGLRNWRQALADAEQAVQLDPRPNAQKVLNDLKNAGARGLR